MNWLIIAFLAPLLWAVCNFIDKFLVSKHSENGIGTLIMYSCFIAFPVALLILIFKPEVLQISLKLGSLISLSGLLFVLYLFPYFKALHKADTSIVIPLFQVIPIFEYFIAFIILGEVLSKMQLIASALIIVGAIGISIKFEGRKTRLRHDVVILMLLASLIVALNAVLFKFFAIRLDFWTTVFWQNIGFLIFGLILFIFIKSYRVDFTSSFKKKGKKIISLNVLNEVINLIAVLVFAHATLLAPIALVGVINGFQPLFVFLIGLLLTIITPHLIKEEIGKRMIIQKILFIVLMIVGAYMLGSG